MKKKKQVTITNKMLFEYWKMVFFRNIIFFFTKYYPFSNYYRNSIYHYENRFLRIYEDAIIRNLRKIGIKWPVYVPNYSKGSSLVTYYLGFYKHSYEQVLKKKEKLINGIAKDFGVSPEVLYFNATEEEQDWKLQIPSEHIFKD